VIAATELDAAVFHDPEPPPLRPVFGIQLFEPHDAVRDALHLEIVVDRRHVVEQDHGAVASRKKLLERQNLPPIAERRAEESQLRQRVEDYPGRLQPFHIRQNQLGRRRQFDLRRMEHRVLLVRVKGLLGRDELPDIDALQLPAVRLGHRPKLFLGLGKRDIQHGLAVLGPFHQILHRQRCLSRSGHAFNGYRRRRVRPPARMSSRPGTPVAATVRGWISAKGSVICSHTTSL
jgi:hypothetical protein